MLKIEASIKKFTTFTKKYKEIEEILKSFRNSNKVLKFKEFLKLEQSIKKIKTNTNFFKNSNSCLKSFCLTLAQNVFHALFKNNSCIE